MSPSEDDFLLDLTNGTLQGRSRTMLDEWPDMRDSDVADCLKAMQTLVHAITSGAAYTVEIHTTDGHEHEAPTNYPIVEGDVIPLLGTDEQQPTTADETPGQVHVSDIKRIYFRVYS